MNWITIQRFTYPHELAIPRSLLEANGIETITMDETTTQIHNFYSNAIGGIKLQVHEKDYDKAYQILSEGGFLSEPQVASKNSTLEKKSLLKIALILLGLVVIVVLMMVLGVFKQ